MGFRDKMKNKFGSATRKFNKIIDKGSELKDKISDIKDNISDIKEDPSGKLVEKIRENFIDDISFGDVLGTNNVRNNPSFRKKESQYTQKAESFSSFVKPGIPHLVFKVETEKSVTTRASRGSSFTVKQLEKVNSKLGLADRIPSEYLKAIEISQDIPNVSKQFKIPIDPSFLSSSYTFNYTQYNAKSDLDFSFLQNQSMRNKDGDLSLGKTWDGVAATGAKVGKILSNELLNIGKDRFSNSAIGKQLSLQTGIAINPNMENAFTGVDFRNLSFSFELIPRNEKQAKEMQQIVHLLKFWSHPDTIDGTDSKVLRFPFNWLINYNDGQGGTTGVSFKTKLCYCTSIKVEYGSSNGYILMKDNLPTSVKIALSFVENAYITRRDIGDDYTNGGNF